MLTSKPYAKLFCVVHNIVILFVVHIVIQNVIHNTELWPFVIQNLLEKAINSLKTVQNYIMSIINDKKPFSLHKQSWVNNFAKNWALTISVNNV